MATVMQSLCDVQPKKMEFDENLELAHSICKFGSDFPKCESPTIQIDVAHAKNKLYTLRFELKQLG